MAYAVVARSRCRMPWAVDLRHARATCPRCQTGADLARRRRLWEGDDARAAQAAAAHVAAACSAPEGQALEQVRLTAEPQLPRHDVPTDAAAAQARRVRGTCARADAVAAWLTRLQGGAEHDELVATLVKAGLDASRAEKEVVRMLACDVLFEPRPGFYQALE